MKSGFKLVTVLIGILGVGDLVAVPFMIAEHRHTLGEPPAPAIVAVFVIAIATLASTVGLAQGRRWALGVALTCRGLDSLSSLLGLIAHPSAMLTVIAAVTLVLSVAATALLIRLSPHLASRPASDGTAATNRQSP
jgi:hypothetical protein